MVELFSEPDVDILADSSGTVHLCNPNKGVTVVSIMSIHSVVAMFPDMQVNPSGAISVTGKFSLMQHPYIKVAQFSGDNSFRDGKENVY